MRTPVFEVLRGLALAGAAALAGCASSPDVYEKHVRSEDANPADVALTLDPGRAFLPEGPGLRSGRAGRPAGTVGLAVPVAHDPDDVRAAEDLWRTPGRQPLPLRCAAKAGVEQHAQLSGRVRHQWPA
ncbi:hypothetical protein G6F22_020303 [Rhizopus arrhizus]|nr:hypothetical protein G6F22_020303 [Rhizopus arrhizus]